MNILLDTCTFLWLIFDNAELSDTARKIFTEPDNDVYLSAASCWEISIKSSLGRLRLPEEPGLFLPKQRSQHLIEPLPITEAATLPPTPSSSSIPCAPSGSIRSPYPHGGHLLSGGI
jgi:PIN domain nuclease of toxin-antitoxin system